MAADLQQVWEKDKREAVNNALRSRGFEICAEHAEKENEDQTITIVVSWANFLSAWLILKIVRVEGWREKLDFHSTTEESYSFALYSDPELIADFADKLLNEKRRNKK